MERIERAHLNRIPKYLCQNPPEALAHSSISVVPTDIELTPSIAVQATSWRAKIAANKASTMVESE